MTIYAKHGLPVRLAYLAMAVCWWMLLRLFRFLRIGTGDRIVLCYHAVPSGQAKQFAWQMSRIASRAADITKISAPLPAEEKMPRVWVTFDDGFACLKECALPILRRLAIPALIFPVTGNLRTLPRWKMSPDHPEAGMAIMSSEDIIWLAHEGLCRFGSHTRTHPDLVRVSPPSIKQELTQSRNELERLVGMSVEDLALPYGSYDPEVLTLAFEAGYQRVFTLDPQPVRPGRDANGKVIGRFSMAPDVWRIEFLLTVEGAYAWLGAWRSLFHGVQTKVTRVFQGALSSS
jgi:peptidoglycan/xylan/chitin deacetylase (PgdA/CDA1 family)